jgi:O-antigen/teichoic acid export membrane protein
MPSLKEKSIKGLFWDFSGRIGLQGVGFIVSIVLARLLAPEEFGLLAIINVFINLAAVFVDYGFNIALIQKKEINERHYTAVFYLNLIMGFTLATIVFLLAPIIGRFYEKDILINITRLMSLGIFINSFGHVMRSKLLRSLNFKSISITNICAATLSGIISLVLALKGFGLWSLAIQSILYQLTANILLYLFSKFRISFKFSFNALKELWSFSSKIFLSGLLDTLFYNIDSLLIGKLLNPKTLGYYQRSKSLENFGFRYTASTIASVLFPSLSSIQDDSDKFSHAVMKIFHLLSFISFLGCGLFLVGGRELIIILFSAKWEPSVVMFQILISGAFASQGISLFNNVLLSSNQSQTYLSINFINKLLLLMNFGVLILWDLKSYLAGFVIIQLFIYYLGMFKTSNFIGLKNRIIHFSFRYVAIYILSSISTILFKNSLEIIDLYLRLIFSLVFFSSMYLVLSRIFNSEGFSISRAELEGIFKSFLKFDKTS